MEAIGQPADAQRSNLAKMVQTTWRVNLRSNCAAWFRLLKERRYHATRLMRGSGFISESSPVVALAAVIMASALQPRIQRIVDNHAVSKLFVIILKHGGKPQ